MTFYDLNQVSWLDSGHMIGLFNLIVYLKQNCLLGNVSELSFKLYRGDHTRLKTFSCPSQKILSIAEKVFSVIWSLPMTVNVLWRPRTSKCILGWNVRGRPKFGRFMDESVRKNKTFTSQLNSFCIGGTRSDCDIFVHRDILDCDTF